MIDEEVEEHTEEHQKVLTNEEMEDLIKSYTEEQEGTEIDPSMWALEKFGKVFQMEQNLKIMDYGRMMKCSIKVTRMLTEALHPLQEMFNELKRQKQQLPITMFFHKVEKKKVSTMEDPQPATSSVPDVIYPSSFSSAQSSPPSEEDDLDVPSPVSSEGQ